MCLTHRQYIQINTTKLINILGYFKQDFKLQMLVGLSTPTNVGLNIQLIKCC